MSIEINNSKFEEIVFTNCKFSNIRFENCTFHGIEGIHSDETSHTYTPKVIPYVEGIHASEFCHTSCGECDFSVCAPDIYLECDCDEIDPCSTCPHLQCSLGLNNKDSATVVVNPVDITKHFITTHNIEDIDREVIGASLHSMGIALTKEDFDFYGFDPDDYTLEALHREPKDTAKSKFCHSNCGVCYLSACKLPGDGCSGDKCSECPYLACMLDIKDNPSICISDPFKTIREFMKTNYVTPELLPEIADYLTALGFELSEEDEKIFYHNRYTEVREEEFEHTCVKNDDDDALEEEFEHTTISQLRHKFCKTNCRDCPMCVQSRKSGSCQALICVIGLTDEKNKTGSLVRNAANCIYSLDADGMGIPDTDRKKIAQYLIDNGYSISYIDLQAFNISVLDYYDMLGDRNPFKYEVTRTGNSYGIDMLGTNKKTYCGDSCTHCQFSIMDRHMHVCIFGDAFDKYCIREPFKCLHNASVRHKIPAEKIQIAWTALLEKGFVPTDVDIELHEKMIKK